MVNNRVGAIYSYPTQGWLEPTIMDVNGNQVEEAFYSPLMPLEAVDGIEPVLLNITSTSTNRAWGFTSSMADKKDVVARFLDVMYSDEFIELSNWGIEGKTYVVRDGEKVKVDALPKDDPDYKESQAVLDSGYGTIVNLVGNALIPGIGMQSIVTVDPESPNYEKQYFYRYAPLYENNSFYNDYCYMAMPSEEETNVELKYQTDLETFSDEAFTQFVLGQRSLDELDQVIEEMKSNGLLELIASKQSRADRYEGNTGYTGPIE